VRGDDRERQMETDPRSLRRSRACLIISIVVYLGLAWLSTLWLPDYAFIAWILVFFGAQSAAYLLVHEVRGDRDGSTVPREDER
jgi:predicted metal-binding membrane protein